MLKRLLKVLLVFVAFILLIFYIKCPRTPAFKDKKGEVIKGSIASLKKIELGGLDQWVLIRGKNEENPLLLFLHGGPGMPMMYLGHTFQKQLEDSFVVVHWDQRGAGKSFYKDIPVETMNVEQILSDAHELVRHLLVKFERRRLYIVGHSWGSYIGMLLVSRHPELFYAYVGVGQVVDGERAEGIAHQFIRERATETGNEEALAELDSLGAAAHEKWLFKFGGVLKNKTSWLTFLWDGLLSTEYSLFDAWNVARGSSFSSATMNYNAIDGPLFEEITSVKVPLYLFAGRYDFTTPSELAELYFNRIAAPSKKIVWFEDSAHFPFYEEPEGFTYAMIQMVLKETYQKNGVSSLKAGARQ